MKYKNIVNSLSKYRELVFDINRFGNNLYIQVYPVSVLLLSPPVGETNQDKRFLRTIIYGPYLIIEKNNYLQFLFEINE